MRIGSRRSAFWQWYICFRFQCLIYQAALQGLSLGKESMYISMTRQAILPLVFAFLLKGFGNLNLIWGAFVLAELCGIPLAAALWKRKGEKQIQF